MQPLAPSVPILPPRQPTPEQPHQSPLHSPVSSDDGADADADAGHDPDSPLVDISTHLPIPPLEDVAGYGDLVRKMATCLGISTSQATQEVDDVIFDIIQSQLSPTVSIPISKVMLEAAKASWSKPSLFPVSTKCLDHMYQTQEESAPFLFLHPSPNSLVVSSSSKGHRQHSTSPDREGKKLDPFGRWLYSVGSLGIKSCNYMVFMA